MKPAKPIRLAPSKVCEETGVIYLFAQDYYSAKRQRMLEPVEISLLEAFQLWCWTMGDKYGMRRK